MSIRRPIALAACGALLATALVVPSGAGASSSTPYRLLRDSIAGIATAKTMRLTIAGKDAKVPTTMVVAVDRAGSVGLHIATKTSTADILLVHARTFVAGDRGYWANVGKLPAKTATQLANRWVEVPPVKELAAMAKAMRPARFARCMRGDFDDDAPRGLRRGPDAVVGGRRYVVLIDPGTEPGGQPSRAWLTTGAHPRLARVVATGPQRPGGDDSAGATAAGCGPADAAGSSGGSDDFELDSMRFDYNLKFTIRAPASAIDLTKSGGAPKTL